MRASSVIWGGNKRLERVWDVAEKGERGLFVCQIFGRRVSEGGEIEKKVG